MIYCLRLFTLLLNSDSIIIGENHIRVALLLTVMGHYTEVG